MQPVLTESKGCFLSCVRSDTRKETISCYILKQSGKCRHFLSGLQMQHNESFTRAHAHTLARKQIIDILASRTHRSQGSRWCLFSLYSILPSHAPLMGAVSVLICVSCQRAACLVKSGNRNANEDGAEVEAAERAAERAVESRPGRTDILLHPPGQLFDKHFTFRPTCPGVIPLS